MILLTGFEKFNKLDYNLSKLIVSKFPNNVGSNQIEKLILPVKWKSCLSRLFEKIKSIRSIPYLIILTGVHEKKYISIEKRAFNFQLGLDEEHRFKCKFINLKSPINLISNINLRELLKISKTRKFFNLSDYPGLYLCNYIYFNVLDYYKQDTYIVLIHFPSSGSVINCISILNLIIKSIIT